MTWRGASQDEIDSSFDHIKHALNTAGCGAGESPLFHQSQVLRELRAHSG